MSREAAACWMRRIPQGMTAVRIQAADGPSPSQQSAVTQPQLD
jgi:hypothetical protein